MIVTDVNPLVYAYRSDTQAHVLSRSVLQSARDNADLLVLPDVAASFIRIVTSPRIFRNPDRPREALTFIEALMADGRSMSEGRITRWAIFREILEGEESRASRIPDALLAATCRDLGAAILTADRDFLSFTGLRVNLITPHGLIDHTVA